MRDCFLKFSKDENHLIDFVENGHVYINTSTYFSKCESEDIGQNDKLEMVSSYHQNQGASIELAGREFKITRPFSIRNGDPEYSHIFCLYTLSDESIMRSEKGKVFDGRIWDEFGDYFVFIHDAHSFMKALDLKLKELNLRYKADYVEYFCPSTYEGDVGAFRKRNSFSHQEEFRVATDGPVTEEPITDIYLGSLNDVAYGPVHRNQSVNLFSDNKIAL